MMTTDEKIDLILTEIGGMKTEIGGMKTEIGGMKTEISGIKTEIDGMRSDIRSLDKRLLTMELVVENEIKRDIRIIAEGHMDLSRKLDEALKTSQTNALYHIKVNGLASDVRELKEEFDEFKKKQIS